MPKPVEELRLDAEELKRLMDLSTRQSVKDFLSIEARRLETEISVQVKDNTFNLDAKPAATSAAGKCYEVKITNYAWDQSDKFFKLFVTLKNVQNLPGDKVVCMFSERSMELAVKELDGKNYTLTIKNLAEMIDPTKSTWKVKTDSVVVFLAKCKPVTWTGVTVDEKKSKESKLPAMDPNDVSDPQASLMNLMKKMYQEGDDDMKRQITKSFVESQSGKKPDLGMGF